ncbi:MAG TPA: hypothetical protein PLO51_04450, partial [Candidatus Micrarchaeota archaeon]|nr:hypothetical protein [Candidatus Micrarchaeota archaeon]
MNNIDAGMNWLLPSANPEYLKFTLSNAPANPFLLKTSDAGFQNAVKGFLGDFYAKFPELKGASNIEFSDGLAAQVKVVGREVERNIQKNPYNPRVLSDILDQYRPRGSYSDMTKTELLKELGSASGKERDKIVQEISDNVKSSIERLSKKKAETEGRISELETMPNSYTDARAKLKKLNDEISKYEKKPDANLQLLDKTKEMRSGLESTITQMETIAKDAPKRLKEINKAIEKLEKSGALGLDDAESLARLKTEKSQLENSLFSIDSGARAQEIANLKKSVAGTDARITRLSDLDSQLQSPSFNAKKIKALFKASVPDLESFNVSKFMKFVVSDKELLKQYAELMAKKEGLLSEYNSLYAGVRSKGFEDVCNILRESGLDPSGNLTRKQWLDALGKYKLTAASSPDAAKFVELSTQIIDVNFEIYGMIGSKAMAYLKGGANAVKKGWIWSLQPEAWAIKKGFLLATEHPFRASLLAYSYLDDMAFDLRVNSQSSAGITYSGIYSRLKSVV